jgi:hypothetical protein
MKYDSYRRGSAERCPWLIVSFFLVNRSIPFLFLSNKGITPQKEFHCYYVQIVCEEVVGKAEDWSISFR